MLNGKNCLKNDFTCIRPQGCYVVDYCLVSHDSLHLYINFTVVRARELVQKAGLQGCVGIPDHSILTWEFSFGNNFDNDESGSKIQAEVGNVKFHVNNMSNDFLPGEICDSLFETVHSLEQSFRKQENIDDAYKSLCSLVNNEMNEKLPCKKLLSKSCFSNKRRKVYKPWWNEYLTNLWNDVCLYEKQWLKTSNSSDKIMLKHCIVISVNCMISKVRNVKENTGMNCNVSFWTL